MGKKLSIIKTAGKQRESSGSLAVIKLVESRGCFVQPKVVRGRKPKAHSGHNNRSPEACVHDKFVTKMCG